MPFDPGAPASGQDRHRGELGAPCRQICPADRLPGSGRPKPASAAASPRPASDRPGGALEAVPRDGDAAASRAFSGHRCAMPCRATGRWLTPCAARAWATASRLTPGAPIFCRDIFQDRVVHGPAGKPGAVHISPPTSPSALYEIQQHLVRRDEGETLDLARREDDPVERIAVGPSITGRLYRRNPVRDPRRPSEEPDWGPHALAVPRGVKPRRIGSRRSAYEQRFAIRPSDLNASGI